MKGIIMKLKMILRMLAVLAFALITTSCSNLLGNSEAVTTTPITYAAILGITAPVTGSTPVTVITETIQYTGTISWSGTPAKFTALTTYTATITLTPKTGYTLSEITTDFFTVAGVTTVSNSAGSGVVTAIFPPTVLAIGNEYQGGKVAYLLQSSDVGFESSVPHGLISATVDQSTEVAWITGGTTQTTLLTGTSTAYGSGQANTTAMLGQAGFTGGAAKVCDEYINIEEGTGIYSDWYLPSKGELEKLYINRVAIGNFTNGRFYWSSSEDNATYAWPKGFNNGLEGSFPKSNDNEYIGYHVRAVRNF